MKDLHSQRYLVEEGALSIWKGLSGQVLLWGTAEMFMGRWGRAQHRVQVCQPVASCIPVGQPWS